MPEFETTGVLRLTNARLVGHTDTPLVSGTCHWDGWLDQPYVGTVSDQGPTTGLDRGIDSIAGFDFTGYYIEIGGQNFGIFKSGPSFVVPYNADMPIHSTEVFPNAPGSTSYFTESLSTAANCFLTGALIATPTGPRPIETLSPGDKVQAAGGDVARVRWVWRQTVTSIHGLSVDRSPVRIAAGTLGPGCPARDLFLSADHAICLEGLLINAGALVNGESIQRMTARDMPGQFTYWHVETEAHDLILAEGLPTESFIDYSARDGFDNYAAYVAAGGKNPVIVEMALPRISSARLLPPKLKQRLLAPEAA